MTTKQKPFAPPFEEWLDKEPPQETHRANSKRLQARSGRTLREGERLTSSEEIWGAAAHAVKAVARRRGWPHHSDSALSRIADYIGETVDNDNIGLLFTALEMTRYNSHYNRLSPTEVALMRTRLRRFLALLQEADKAIPDDAEPPTDRTYRRDAAAHLSRFHQRAAG